MFLTEALVIAGITGCMSYAGTLAAIKTDVKWIKKKLHSLEARIIKLEEHFE